MYDTQSRTNKVNLNLYEPQTFYDVQIEQWFLNYVPWQTIIIEVAKEGFRVQSLGLKPISMFYSHEIIRQITT